MSGYAENMLLPIPKAHACLVTNIPSHTARLPCSCSARAQGTHFFVYDQMCNFPQPHWAFCMCDTMQIFLQ